MMIRSINLCICQSFCDVCNFASCVIILFCTKRSFIVVQLELQLTHTMSVSMNHFFAFISPNVMLVVSKPTATLSGKTAHGTVIPRDEVHTIFLVSFYITYWLLNILGPSLLRALLGMSSVDATNIGSLPGQHAMGSLLRPKKLLVLAARNELDLVKMLLARHPGKVSSFYLNYFGIRATWHDHYWSIECPL